MNAELVERARAGDRDAFDVLAAGSVDRLYAIATLNLRDGDRAEDARPGDARSLLARPPRSPRRGSIRRVAVRLLFRAINDEFRTVRRHEARIRVLRVEPSTADESGSVAVRERLDCGFERLSPEHRAVIVLRLYLGLSVEDTAAAIGIRPGTAKSRLHYAVAAMRVALEAKGRPSIEGATRDRQADVERLIAEWLTDEAPSRAPDRILTASTARIDPERPWMRSRIGRQIRLPFGRRSAGLVAAALAIVVVGLAFGGILPGWRPGPDGVGSSSPSPTPLASSSGASQAPTSPVPVEHSHGGRSIGQPVRPVERRGGQIC